MNSILLRGGPAYEARRLDLEASWRTQDLWALLSSFEKPNKYIILFSEISYFKMGEGDFPVLFLSKIL